MPVALIRVPLGSRGERGELSEAAINIALALLVALNRTEIATAARARRSYLPLYASGVVYQREQRGAENWQGIAEIYANKRADCEDLACARVAQLIAAGEDARPHAYKTPSGGWHIVVRRANGTLEDPSARLGMNRKS